MQTNSLPKADPHTSQYLREIRAAFKNPPVGPRGVADPWREFAIAVCDNARFMAMGCFSPSPIRRHRDDIRQLIKEVYEYSQQHGLPVRAEISLATAAMLMGVELTGVIKK